MIVSSRTPEGEPNVCSICGAEVDIDPSKMTGDAPCPDCGHLLWFPENAVTVIKEIDTTDIDALLSLEPKRLSARMLLDFQGVTFLSSGMITKLVLLNKAVKARQGKLKFCNVSPNVYEVFKITKMNMLFDISNEESWGSWSGE